MSSAIFDESNIKQKNEVLKNSRALTWKFKFVQFVEFYCFKNITIFVMVDRFSISFSIVLIPQIIMFRFMPGHHR